MEQVKSFFMTPIFWGITVGHLMLTILGVIVSVFYVSKYSK